MRFDIILAALLLSLGLYASALEISERWGDHQSAQQTLSVVGSARKEITANLGTFGFTLAGSGDSPSAAVKEVERQKPALIEFLRARGFEARMAPFSQSQDYEYNSEGQLTGRVLRHNAFQRFEVQSSDVQKIAQLSLDMGSLIQEGLYLTLESPQYLFTELADARREAQALAAADAMSRGQKIAESTNVKLGALRSARMGVVQITPRNSTDISDYGVNDTSSIEKDITAVVQVSFSLERR